MQRVSELKTEPVVGKFYLVPCVKYRGAWFPVIGPPHDDVEHIGVPDHHYHYDVRFLNKKDVGGFMRRRVVKRRPTCTPEEFAMIWFVPTDSIYYGLQYKPMKCKRRMPDFPVVVGFFPAPWKQKLERAYKGASAKCGRCPHRGMDLRSLPVKDGVVVCNGHGLAFNVQTGKLVKRTA
jgi:hypothetical protein